MTHQFDPQAREAFFDQVFAPTQVALLEKGEITHLHPRDLILLDILSDYPAGARILDYGCGQGRLLGELLSRGYDAFGYEPSQGMGQIAASHAVPPERIFVGSDDLLRGLTGQKFDFVLLMGVMQYLSDAERDDVFKRCRSYLKPSGRLVATFQNGLFDLFTFNKYTIDAIVNMLLEGQLSSAEGEALQAKLSGLLTNAAEPRHSSSRARDNIFVRLSNPLTIEAELGRHGFAMERRSFYEWFGVPPLLKGAFGDTASRIKEAFEVVNAEDWRGHFMANAFLVTARLG